MDSTFHVVAIDGGAGTGKSTTASLLSKRLNFLHVDTGSHYRSVTKHLLDNEISLTMLDSYFDQNNILLTSEVNENRSHLAINGLVYAADLLRSAKINQAVCNFASNPKVRQILLSYQREQIEVARSENKSGLVMEGRDIGTVIFPDADLKVFLVADQKVRESRRINDGEVDQIASRDQLDSSRSIAPLKESGGSLRVDTSLLTVEEVYVTISKSLGF
jgi:cytidylate kinase